MLVLSLSLVMAAPAGATTVGASAAPAANVSPGQTNALVMDITIGDGGDSLVAGTAPSAGTATADGTDTDWAIDSYDKTDGGGPFAWDSGNDLLAIDDDADSKYTAQGDTTLAGVPPSAGTSLVTAAIAAWQGAAIGTVSYYDAAPGGAWASGSDAIWVEVTADDAYTIADTLLAGTAPPDPTAETGDGGKNTTDWTTINLYDAVGANAWDAGVDGIIEDFHAGGTYSAAADTYVVGADPTDGTPYTSNNAFDADWGMDSYDAADGDAWNSVADAIIVDADTNDTYLDQLNAITLKNTETAVNGTDIGEVNVWVENGTTAGFQADEDTSLGSAAWDDSDSWDLSALTTDILAAGQRIYVTASLQVAATVGRTIIMQVPTLADAVAPNGAFDAGEEGLFLASDDDTGNITNANTQTIVAGAAAKFTLSAPADITAGGRAAYTVTLTDAGSNPVNATTDETVYLYTDSTGADAAFYDAATGGNVITSVTIANGASTAGFWYYDRLTGNWTITASDADPADGATGITDATDALSVTRTGGGGGWTPPAPSDVDTNLFGSVSTFEISASGEVQETITATSAEGDLTCRGVLS